MISTEHLLPVFKEISETTGFSLGHDTHYDAQNYELTQFRGTDEFRLDFQPMEDGSIQVTQLIDRYPAAPRLFKFLRNVVPMFPNVAKTEHLPIATIDAPFSIDELEIRAREIVRDAM